MRNAAALENDASRRPDAHLPAARFDEGARGFRVELVERTARQALVNERQQHLHDQVSRAYGTLKTARTISSEETMHLLSSVRLGINLGLIDDLEIPTVNEMFIHTQPAHLQKLQGTTLEVDERNVARASYLRSRLGNGKAPVE